MIKWDKKKVKEVYSNLCIKYGNKAITSNQIRKEGFGNLPSMIIKFYGKKENLDIELGYSPFLSTWDIQRTYETYKQICEKYGGPVGVNILKKEAHKTLSNMIIKYYGGKENLDIILGYKPTKIFWSKEKTKEIYAGLCKDNGGPVSQKFICEKGYSTLASKISEYWVDKQNLDIELGYNPKKKKWTKKEVIEVYSKLCLDNGNKSVPQEKCLEVSGLVNAILKFYTSKVDLDLELGYKPFKLNWTREMVIEEYIKICESNDGKSTNVRNVKDKNGDLGKQIKKYFGNKENLDIELGYTPIRKQWTKERVIEEYRELCKNNGDKPFVFSETSDENSALHTAIGKRFGSKLKLDELLGYKPLRTNWTKKMIKETYHKLCLANGDKPISGDVLVSMGYNDLTTAMSRHYRKRDLDNDLGYETSTVWDIDLVKKTYKELCEKHGNRTLSQTELKLLGFGKLIQAINTYCGSKSELDFELGFTPYKLFRLQNGMIVRSTYEVMFGNFLIKNNIKFTTDKIICKNCSENYRYDFLINDLDGNKIYFEIWGGDDRTIKNTRFKDYIEKRKVKTEFYKKLNLKLVDIESDIFKNKSHESIIELIKKIIIKNNVKKDNFVSLTVDELIESDNNRLWDKQKVKDEYHKICLANGNQPTSTTDLGNLNRSDLLHAIRDYWGKKKFLDIDLGYEAFYVEWTRELVIEKALEIGKKHNLSFLSSDFIRENIKSLDSAIYRLFDSRKEFHEIYQNYFNESLQN